MTQEKKPLVTIVTITFDLIKSGREKTFRQCLESVHNQTYENIEHIVVDGASKDGTIDMIKEYADKGWVRYISEPDDGIYDAMNKGIKMAHGKYIAFLNSDDYYNDKRGIEISIGALEKNKADFSYAPVEIKFSDGKIFKNHPQCNPKISDVFFTMAFSHQSMITKREVLLNEGMFDVKYRSAADYDLVVRLCLKKYRSVFVDMPFVSYLFEGVSSKNQDLSVNEIAKVYQKNYSKLCSISDDDCKKMCQNIYTGKYYENVPSILIKKLKNMYPYFDYDDYILKNKEGNGGYLRHLLKNIKKRSMFFTKE